MRNRFLLLSTLLIPALIFGDWDIEIPYDGSSGKSASIGLDNNNNPHMLYFVDDDHFYHIYKSNSVWYGPYPIDTVNYFTYCRMVDLAMVGDTAHALMSMEYTATGDYLLWGKHLGSGTWSIEQIPSTLVSSDAGGYINVAITPGTGSSLFHVIYVHYNYGSPILYYRKYTGIWTSAEEVASIPDVSAGWQNDVAIDANDDPHVAFVYSDEGVKYRKKSGDLWEPIELVSSTTDPTFTSIAVDGSDYPHVAYDKDDWGAVCYRFKTSSGWQPEENVGTGGGWNKYGASIAVTGDKKFVAYYAIGDLKFAIRTATGWISEDVDTAGTVGTYPSLIIDDESYAHIAYRDSTNDRLKYAKSTEPVGIKEVEQLSNIKSHILTLQIHPNPFSKKIDIILNVPDEQLRMKHFSLKIYDVSGELIKSFLFPASNSSLPNSVVWDGRDNSDKQLPNGVYFLKFKAGDYTETRKLLLIR